MKCGGHIEGYAVGGDYLIAAANALGRFADQEEFDKNYGDEAGPVTAFAVGDGNHSLAAARHCWELIKSQLTAGQALKLSGSLCNGRACQHP